jgi:hypothetical protein
MWGRPGWVPPEFGRAVFTPEATKGASLRGARRLCAPYPPPDKGGGGHACPRATPPGPGPLGGA